MIDKEEGGASGDEVLFVIQCSNLGGMEQSSIILFEEMVRRGYRISLLSLNPVGELRSALESLSIDTAGLNYHPLTVYSDVRSYLRTIDASVRFKAIVQIGHNIQASIAIAQCRGPRKVLKLHYHHEFDLVSRLKWMLHYQLARRIFSEVSFCSAYIRDQAASFVPEIARLASVDLNPFKVPERLTQEAKSTARSVFGLSRDHVVIGNAGWLIQRKRFDLFIEVAAIVARQCPEAVFLVAGDGPERATLERLAQTRGISDRIQFLGWQANLHPFYSSLDLMLFNSDDDALGRTPIEAAAYEVAVVASVLRGGLQEVLRDGEHGYILNQHDVAALAERVLFLVRSNEARQRIAEAGAARVRELLSPARHCDEFLKYLVA